MPISVSIAASDVNPYGGVQISGYYSLEHFLAGPISPPPIPSAWYLPDLQFPRGSRSGPAAFTGRWQSRRTPTPAPPSALAWLVGNHRGAGARKKKRSLTFRFKTSIMGLSEAGTQGSHFVNPLGPRTALFMTGRLLRPQPGASFYTGTLPMAARIREFGRRSCST